MFRPSESAEEIDVFRGEDSILKLQRIYTKVNNLLIIKNPFIKVIRCLFILPVCSKGLANLYGDSVRMGKNYFGGELFLPPLVLVFTYSL